MRLPLPTAAALLTLLAVAACSWAEEDAQGDWPDPNPLIYEITNAAGEVEGWMLGTIHALPDGIEWRTANIDAAIENADLLLVEVAELNDSSTLASTFSSLATTPGMGPLEARVEPDLRGTLEAMLERSSYSSSDFADVEDWAAAIMLARVDALGDPANGVDKALIADFSDRNVVGFESASGQLGIFDQLAAQDQRDLLEGTVIEWDTSRTEPGRLMKAWIRGDATVLEEATTTGIMGDPELRAALLVDRNKNWAQQLAIGLQYPERPLVAVGAAHLVGPDSVPAMLEARGFTVRRLE